MNNIKDLNNKTIEYRYSLNVSDDITFGVEIEYENILKSVVDEKIIYKINNKDHNEVELANYIFDNDIDKEYFLIQTLKTNKEYKKELPNHKIYH